jgi:hypothetical protein
MGLPALAKAYDFHGINQRIPFVSVIDAAASVMFKTKDEAKTYGGWTVQWSCDGVTGPANAADHTDRWASKANCQVRATIAGAAQSWIVLNDTNGGQLLIAFMGGNDDVFFLAYSAGALYTLAGTATFQPTAADAQTISTALTMVNNTASADRIFHVMVSTDGKVLRAYVYRSGVLIRAFGVEAISPTIQSGMAFTPPVVVWNDSSSNYGVFSPQSFGAGVAGGVNGSCSARVAGATIAIGGGGEAYSIAGATGNTFSVAAPELQAANILVPLCFSCVAAGSQGKLGNRFDCWFPWSNGISQGDTYGALQFVCMDVHVIPWDGASPVVLV